MSFVEGSYDQVPSAMIPSQGLYEESETKQARLGTKLLVGERTYRYAWASNAHSKALLVGSLCDDDYEGTVTVAHPIGTFEVTVTAEGAITANQYTDGYLIVTSSTGAGDIYRIKEHPACASGTFTVTLLDPLRTAWELTTCIRLRQSPYRTVALAAAAGSQLVPPAGICLSAVTDEYYYWLQTGGPAPFLIDATGTFGAVLGERYGVASTNVAGAIMKPDANGLVPIVGLVYNVAEDLTDTEYGIIKLQLEY